MLLDITLDRVYSKLCVQSLKTDFDGTTVLCQVCGDKASGFHYGVHSCEGCKGFFRRSIQQKIQYKPCTKTQNCSILRMNRNRCQYCRLKKCISVGMSRDAVRFGRVPKREKAKILAAMQSVNQKYHERVLISEIEDEQRLVHVVVSAHIEHCEFVWDKITARLQKSSKSVPTTYTSESLKSCPLSHNQTTASDFNSAADSLNTSLFGPHIRSVVGFAKQLPGFMQLPEEDRITLLKSSVFEVLLVWLARLFDTKRGVVSTLDGCLIKRDCFPAGSQSRFLLDSMFNFAEHLNCLQLNDAEIGLFCACVVLTSSRPGLRFSDIIARVHRKVENALATVLLQNHSHVPDLFERLRQKVHDLKTLNTLHADMIHAMHVSSGFIYINNPAEHSTVCTSAYKDVCTSPRSLSSGYVGSEEGSLRSSSAASPESCLVSELMTNTNMQSAQSANRLTSVSPDRSSPSSSSHSDEYMPLLKQALSKPVSSASLSMSEFEFGRASSNGIIDQKYVPHKKFRWMRREHCVTSAVDSANDIITFKDEMPDEEYASTPTLSRILEAPPREPSSWSFEANRRRETLTQLLSIRTADVSSTSSTSSPHHSSLSHSQSTDSNQIASHRHITVNQHQTQPLNLSKRGLRVCQIPT